jgi:Flp pilus assembly protein TadD
VSDFGFDAYALDDLDTSGQPDPLEIAHDLIADGKPRAALDLLGDHHDRLGGDPEYLLLCSAAWWACGDTLRARQALQGAARLAPDDPRPLQGLAELLATDGEPDKAELLFAKARALESRVSVIEEPPEDMDAANEEDLIAFAERRERTAQAALTPKQILFGVAAISLVALLIAGIAVLTSPPTEAELDEVEPASEAAMPQIESGATKDSPIPELLEEPEQQPKLEPLAVAPIEPKGEALDAIQPEDARATPIEPPAGVAAPDAPAPLVPKKPSRKPVTARRPSRPEPVTPTTKSTSAPAPATAATSEPPSKTVVQSELETMDPSALTARADKLYAQGHSGLATSYYRRALEIDPDYAPALVGMGRSILRAKKYSEAMSNATRALHLARGVDARPGLEATAIYQMGRVHYERGERDAARRLFRQAISLPGAPAEAWFYLGEALSSDNSPAARQAYEKYLDRVSTGHLADRARRAIQ